MGGADRCSEVRIGLVRRLAAAVVLVEQIESRVIRCETVNVAEFCTLASSVVRIASRLGLERVARDVDESLDAYLKRTYSAARDVKDAEVAP